MSFYYVLICILSRCLFIHSIRRVWKLIAKTNLRTLYSVEIEIMSFTGTWIENDERVKLLGYHFVSQFQRNTVRGGRVVSTRKKNTCLSFNLLSTNCWNSTLRKWQWKESLPRILVSVSVYITPGTKTLGSKDFF